MGLFYCLILSDISPVLSSSYQSLKAYIEINLCHSSVRIIELGYETVTTDIGRLNISNYIDQYAYFDFQYQTMRGSDRFYSVPLYVGRFGY